MTRQETISAAIAFTEKHKESHKIHLENGYIEASAKHLYDKGVKYQSKEVVSAHGKPHSVFSEIYERKRIWAIDKNGVFTTEF